MWFATLRLTGVAYQWYCKIERNRGMPTWEQFAGKISRRFAQVLAPAAPPASPPGPLPTAPSPPAPVLPPLLPATYSPASMPAIPTPSTPTPSPPANPQTPLPASPTPQPPAPPVAPLAVIDPLVGGEQQPLPVKDPSPTACRRLSRPPSSARIFAGSISGRYGSGCPVRRGVVRAPPRAVCRGFRPPLRWIHLRLPAPHMRLPVRGRLRAVRAPPSLATRTLSACASAHTRPPTRPCAPSSVHGRPSTCCRPSEVLQRHERPRLWRLHRLPWPRRPNPR